jgi:hypothetical protein
MSLRWLTFTAGMVVAIVATRSEAEVVFDNGAPDQKMGFYASTLAPDNWVTAATAIDIGAGGLSFNGLHWWGWYYPSNTTPSNEAFTLSIYDPTLTLLTTRQITDLSRQATGRLVGSTNLVEYGYSGDFDRIELPTGNYFIGLSNVEVGHAGWWCWETTSGAAINQAIAYSTTLGWFNAGVPVSAALAFQATSVPEIDLAGLGPVFAIVSGALGLLERRRTRFA